MRAYRFRVACTVVMCVALAGCTPQKTEAVPVDRSSVAPTASETEGGTLAGKPWLIDAINGQKTESPAGARQLFIQFDDPAKSVNGFAGCNTFRASYESTGTSLKLGPLVTTRMACNPVTDKLEATMFQALSQVAGYAIKDAELHLIDAGGAVLIVASTPK